MSRSATLVAMWQYCHSSVAMVMTDVSQKNEINLLRKFAKIIRIFDKIDDSKNRRVIYGPQSFGDFILELFEND